MKWEWNWQRRIRILWVDILHYLFWSGNKRWLIVRTILYMKSVNSSLKLSNSLELHSRESVIVSFHFFAPLHSIDLSPWVQLYSKRKKEIRRETRAGSDSSQSSSSSLSHPSLRLVDNSTVRDHPQRERERQLPYPPIQYRIYGWGAGIGLGLGKKSIMITCRCRSTGRTFPINSRRKWMRWKRNLRECATPTFSNDRILLHP